MGRIYSALIFEGHDLGPLEFVVLDPAFVWVVRDIDVFFPGPNVGSTLSVIAESTSGTLYSITEQAVDAQGVWHQWRGRQVFVPLPETPTLRITSSAAGDGADCRISGYKLAP